MGNPSVMNEGGLFEQDWWLRGYPPDTLLYQPRGMTAEEPLNGFARLNRQAYSFGAIALKVVRRCRKKRKGVDGAEAD
jgi:hypothetical protein